MMNINKLIDRIKKRIGLNGILKDIYNDKVLYDSVINVSLNTLNNMHGFCLKGSLDSYYQQWGMGMTVGTPAYGTPVYSSAQYMVGGANDVVLKIPDEIMNHIKSVGSEIRRVFLTNTSRPTWNTSYAVDMRSELAGVMRNRIYNKNYTTPEAFFKAPNTIMLKNYLNAARYSRLSGYNLYIQCTHPKNLSTISKGIAEFFEELCIYDIMINIYNNELSLLNIDLGNSRVELSLDHFTNAASNRETLIEKFKERAKIDEIKIF